jgi:DNA adenine methylase
VADRLLASDPAAAGDPPAESLLPKEIDKAQAPPLKCHGIKTRLVRFIASAVCWDGRGRWIEPFLGSGAVLFNLVPEKALVGDSNPHVVAFYRELQAGRFDEASVQTCLADMGSKLAARGERYYYEVRDRFNRNRGGSLDFLFLNRACFNGVMRFNSKGGFNVPFCRKPHRFSPAYITRIVNQVRRARRAMDGRGWRFVAADWRQTLSEARSCDFVYLDPPYIGRHTGYHGRWTAEQARGLAEATRQLPCGFALSMWQENEFRRNRHLQEEWRGLVTRSYEHFYHVGATEKLRHRMTEALVIKPGFAARLQQHVGR